MTFTAGQILTAAQMNALESAALYAPHGAAFNTTDLGAASGYPFDVYVAGSTASASAILAYKTFASYTYDGALVTPSGIPNDLDLHVETYAQIDDMRSTVSTTGDATNTWRLVFPIKNNATAKSITKIRGVLPWGIRNDGGNTTTLVDITVTPRSLGTTGTSSDSESATTGVYGYATTSGTLRKVQTYFDLTYSAMTLAAAEWLAIEINPQFKTNNAAGTAQLLFNPGFYVPPMEFGGGSTNNESPSFGRGRLYVTMA